MSLNEVSLALILGAVICYVAFVLYGTRIDGKRQSLREKGLHPVTDPDGQVHAKEERNGNGSERN